MPLEGLRAWIGEVERKLGTRTRVFLVLATIAIGGAGAAIYLAADTRDDAVSESDVRALQEQLEAQIATGGTGTGADLTQLEADLRALEAEVDGLRGGGAGESGAGESGAGSGGAGAGGSSGKDGGTADEGVAGDGGGTAGERDAAGEAGTVDADRAGAVKTGPGEGEETAEADQAVSEAER